MDLIAAGSGAMDLQQLVKEAPLVIFDFDGTLFHIPVDWNRAYEGLSSISREYGHIGNFRSLGEAYIWASKIYRVKDRLVQLQNEFEETGVPGRTEVSAGIAAAKWRLSRDLSCSILSLNTSYTLDRVVGHWGFYPLISIDKVDAPKPDPQGLEMILKAHKKRPEEAVFIGNSNIDMECASRMSVNFIHVEELMEVWFL
jgi:phosphoglycolate phosphatase-like HAD superfamily hydrolase